MFRACKSWLCARRPPIPPPLTCRVKNQENILFQHNKSTDKSYDLWAGREESCELRMRVYNFKLQYFNTLGWVLKMNFCERNVAKWKQQRSESQALIDSALLRKASVAFEIPLSEVCVAQCPSEKFNLTWNCLKEEFEHEFKRLEKSLRLSWRIEREEYCFVQWEEQICRITC